MASWLVRSTPDRAVRAGDIVFCGLGRTLCLYSAYLHRGVQTDTGKFNAGSNPAMD